MMTWAIMLSALAQLEAVVAVAPTPVSVGGRQHLVYELQLTNRLRDSVALQHIDVRGVHSEQPFARYDRQELSSMIGETARAQPLLLSPGKRAVIYFWTPVISIPDSIEHRIVVLAGADTIVSNVGRFTVARRKVAPILGPPLKGGPWVAVYDPTLSRGHRRVLFEAPGGAVHIPARFAVDWMRVDSSGRLTAGDHDVVQEYYAYGSDVLAVADARVASVRDGVSERSTRVHIAHGKQLASGNYITLDIGDGYYVSYEHLQTGSVLVKPGDVVKRGQAIARLGFSGDGSHPHLHMHVSTGNTPMRGEGVPWLLTGYERLGGYADLSSVFAGTPWTAEPAAKMRASELPGSNAVVMFPD